MKNNEYSVDTGVKKIIRYISLITVIAVLIVLSSGIIFVETDEVAMVIRLVSW